MAASLKLGEASMFFLFLEDGECFDLFRALVDGRITVALKDWYQSWTLMMSPCS